VVSVTNLYGRILGFLDGGGAFLPSSSSENKLVVSLSCRLGIARETKVSIK
jgi:hypothetical protein